MATADRTRPSAARLAQAAVALLGILCAAPSLADPAPLEAAKPLRAVKVRHWSLEDGLPQSSINDIAQAPDGQLWLATFGGLVRFDGRRFETFDLTSGLASPRITAIAIDAAGRVALGHQRVGLSMLEAGRFSRPPTPTEAADDATVWALEWRGSELWIATSRGLFVMLDGQSPIRVVEGPAHDVAAQSGAEVVASLGRAVARIVDHRRTATLLDAPARWLADPTGDGAWAMTRTALLRVEAGSATPVVSWPEPLPRPLVTPARDAEGRIWFAVGRRVHVLRPRAGAAPELAVLDVQAPIDTLLVDREQTVWVGTQGAGLWQLVPQPFENLYVRHGLPRRPVRAVVPDGAGGYLVADDCRGVLRIGPGGPSERWFERACVHALARGRGGRVWIGHKTLSALVGGAPSDVAPKVDRRVTALLEDQAGRLWIGTEADGLLRADPRPDATGAPPALGPPTRVLPPHSPVTALVEDEAGRVWAGLRDRVVRFDPPDGPEPSARTFTEEDGVPPGQIRALLPDGGGIWLGSYGGGVAHLPEEGPARPFGPRDGLPDAFVSGLALDAVGRLWLGTNRGLAHVPTASLLDPAAAGAPPTPVDLLPTGEAMGGSPSLVRVGDGLLATTIEGLVRVDLDEVADNPVEPITRLEVATVDGRRLDPAGENPLPPGPGALGARFSTAMTRAPGAVTYEYRLVGLEQAWNRTSAPGRARYEHLPPGEYRFEVRAVNESGRRGPTEAVSFSLAPRLVDTALFEGGVGVLTLLLLLGGHRMRTRLIERRNRALQDEITQRRIAEASLEASEQHYRQVFEHAANSFFLVDARDVVQDVNPQGCALLGRSREDIVSRQIWGLLDGAPGLVAAAPDLTRDEAVRTCRRADGTCRDIRIAVVPLGGDERMVTVTDVTALVRAQAEEQRLREQLLHSQRVEAVGRLAGGVAHEVNNLLTAIQGYADLAKDTLQNDGPREEAVEMIDEVRSGAQQTAQVTRQLLDFARRGERAPSGATDLDRLLASRRAMLRRLCREDVELELRLAGDLPAVTASETQLEQVLLNLVINAVDAMPKGGHLRISTDLVRPGDTSDLTLVDDAVRLTVEDDGVGMTPEVRSRVFDPFFTTKDIGEGTGLGMSAVHGIVTQAEGHIVVHSERGVGTRFDVYLPTTEAAELRPEPTPIVELGAAREARVLYVDDDEAVREATRRMLERQEIEVICCDHPERALEAALEMQDDLHLLITDVVMPGFDGRQLARRVRQRHPGLKVLYVSGYSANTVDLLEAHEHFLSKPYRPNELFAAIAAALAEDSE